MFRCILTRRTNKCFLTIHLLRYFSVLFFVLFSIFFFPSATVSLAVLPFVLFHFPTSFFFTQEKEKKKRVTEDKAVNYKKRIAPGVAPNTHSQCHILHTPKELSLYILFNAHGFSLSFLFCFYMVTCSFSFLNDTPSSSPCTTGLIPEMYHQIIRVFFLSFSLII